tara:strand:+ start:564 stop:734 length:171 start_codon:yes stop_codon:yes gene_type:complete
MDHSQSDGQFDSESFLCDTEMSQKKESLDTNEDELLKKSTHTNRPTQIQRIEFTNL